MVLHSHRFIRLLRLIALVLGALSVLSLVGCGRKGPLYIPDDPKPSPQQTPAPSK